MLLAPIYPTAVVVWHGDSMDVDGHALIVGIMLCLALRLLLITGLNALAARWGSLLSAVRAPEVAINNSA